jgi:hypothetical protein
MLKHSGALAKAVKLYRLDPLAEKKFMVQAISPKQLLRRTKTAISRTSNPRTNHTSQCQTHRPRNGGSPRARRPSQRRRRSISKKSERLQPLFQ